VVCRSPRNLQSSTPTRRLTTQIPRAL